uniref:G-protein coupled receptors family 1 profile domain-containing protein n=1 Tax=Plectus sambesii TaxID=2011161 RepID=A0A914VKF9_9BILA
MDADVYQSDDRPAAALNAKIGCYIELTVHGTDEACRMNGTQLDYVDLYMNTLEKVEGDIFVRRVGWATLFVNVVVVVLGLPCNIYVLYRLSKLAKRDKEKYVNGTGSGLFAMATADLLALLFISLQSVFSGIPLDISHWMASLFCKGLVFMTHMVTSVSIWCWLLMSTLRYLAIRHPLFHLRLWRAPNRAITLIILMSSVTNFWLLIAVDHVDNDGLSCVQSPLNVSGSLNRWMQLIECVWSFCVPVAVILYMDAMVTICRPFKNNSKVTRNARVKCKVCQVF